MKTGLMAKLFAGLVVVLVAVVATQYAASATSTSAKSVPARLTALETKVRSLSTSVKTLKGQVVLLQASAKCLGAQGVVQWGNPAAGQGYVYTTDGGTTAGLTTAFDASAQGQTPTFYAATVDSSCVTGAQRSAFKVDHVASHRAVEAPARATR